MATTRTARDGPGGAGSGRAQFSLQAMVAAYQVCTTGCCNAAAPTGGRLQTMCGITGIFDTRGSAPSRTPCCSA
jgi:hypothetical protein